MPGAEVQTAIGDGDGDANTAKCRFGVGRHIVCTFQRMLVLWTVLRNQAVEDGFHIHANIGIAVFVDTQSTAGVLREDVYNARLWQFWQLAQYFARHQMKTATFRLQGYFYLQYHNGCKDTNKNRYEEISLLSFRENPPPDYDFSFVNAEKNAVLCTEKKK